MAPWFCPAPSFESNQGAGLSDGFPSKRRLVPSALFILIQSNLLQYHIASEIVRDSSDEEDVGSSINQAYDTMFNHNGGFPFAIGGQFESVTDQHPSAIQIFQLWQIYLNNVDPLLKLTHTPTLQVRIIEASANLDKVSRSLEALMFSIYLMAITSTSEEDALSVFNEKRTDLLSKYGRAAQQALVNAEFMRTPDLTLLQAYLLYCVCIDLLLCWVIGLTHTR